MSNFTLTITFASLAELRAYLDANPAAGAEKVASAQPSAPAAPAASVTPITAAAPPAAPAPAADPAPAVTKEECMAKLKQLADSMEDTAPLAALVNKFGVAKFSDLPDDQLPAFANQLKEQFGV